MSENIYITDIPGRIQGGFKPAAGVGLGWIPIAWENADREGTGIAAGCLSGAEELVLDLGLHGDYILHLALGTQTAMRVWVEGDLGFREFSTKHGGNSLQECRLHARTFAGERLHIALKNGASPAPAHLGYIRAEPVQATHQNARNLIAINDGWSWVALDGLESERDASRFFEPLRDSDFFRMLWGIGGADFTASHYTTRGTIAPTNPSGSLRKCDRDHAENFKKLLDGGGDLLRAAVAHARDVGVEIQFYIRPEAFYAPFPYEGSFLSNFYAEHPEWHCRDEFGDEVRRLSYAYPEVQEHMLEFFEELLEYGPDGLCFAFNRGLPMMICEQPVLEECKRISGRYPNLPDEVDSEAMVKARSNIMTGYLERVKQMLAQRGMVFSCIVLGDSTYSTIWGLDFPRLADLGIFESVLVQNGGFHSVNVPADSLRVWQNLHEGGKTKVYYNGWGGSYDHVEAARYLKETVFDCGMPGAFFWDTENISDNPYNWEAIRQGGTMEYLEGLINGEIPPPLIQPHTRIGGTKMDRYNPGNSY